MQFRPHQVASRLGRGLLELLLITAMACDAESSSASDGARDAPAGDAVARDVEGETSPRAPSPPPVAAAQPTTLPAPPPRRARPLDRGVFSAVIPPASTPRRTLPPDLAERGYVEEELVLEGNAVAYAADGALGEDGAWNAKEAGSAAFKTRVLVRRPTDPRAFNGTAFVEWLNVTGGLDAEIGYVFAWEELLRAGFAYVAVSVQRAGVDALKSGDAARFGALVHPGDTYAYDIFAQAGAAIGWPDALDAMRGLKVERLIAYGQSQSAMRMITFANAVQPRTPVFDGFMIHSRAGWGAPIGSEGDGLLGNGKPVRVRGDLDAKVLQLFSESEIFLPLGPAYAARQPDTARIRSWELAGTAHADARLLGAGTDIGCGPANPGHQHYLTKAGLRAMHRWLKDGVEPPKGAPLEVTPDAKALARDANGIARGGVRSPAVDVPIAGLSGEPLGLGALNPACMLFGTTTPFTSERLRTLYPTHDRYVESVTEAARAAREAGFILPEDEPTIIAEAAAAMVP